MAIDPQLRRVCDTCRQYIIGENEPSGVEAPPADEHETTGRCRVCLEQWIADFHAGKFNKTPS